MLLKVISSSLVKVKLSIITVSLRIQTNGISCWLALKGDGENNPKYLIFILFLLLCFLQFLLTVSHIFMNLCKRTRARERERERCVYWNVFVLFCVVRKSVCVICRKYFCCCFVRHIYCRFSFCTSFRFKTNRDVARTYTNT